MVLTDGVLIAAVMLVREKDGIRPGENTGRPLDY